MMRSFGPILSLLLMATPAMASQAQKPQANSPDRIICYAQEKTGTRIGSTKLCLTAGQWEDMRISNRADLDRRDAAARAAIAGRMGMGMMDGKGGSKGPH